MGKPHKHAELIKAWADGAEIQVRTGENKWEDTKLPAWYDDFHYRIKPKPKPDVVLCAQASPLIDNEFAQVTHDFGVMRESYTPNLRLTYCGDTGKLKKAEVIE